MPPEIILSIDICVVSFFHFTSVHETEHKENEKSKCIVFES